MPARTLTFSDIAEPQGLAARIANQYVLWNSAMSEKRAEWRELRNYIFQTSTADTENSALPWKNSTSMPKLTQLRDNLHANYMAALFPNERWLSWVGGDADSELAAKRQAILAYMRNKTEHTRFRGTTSQLVLDWIDTGNAYATTEFVNDIVQVEDEEDVIEYVGPQLVRISPYDISYNITSSSFEDSPKIIRSIKSLGDIKRDLLDRPELGYQEEIFNQMRDVRQRMTSLGTNDRADVDKSIGFEIDGFGTISHYFDSGMVEILEFYGTLYDEVNDELFDNHVITVVDRMFVIRKEPIPSWNKNKIRHVGWRLRPDNLVAMGPLDNLVGMQYRIDHLENLKADVFDLIAHPVQKIKGYVEDFTYGPGERIVLGDDGEVEYDRPPETALNADTQIAVLEQRMEEYAGAPREAMGIRTPGEKTKFEVQTLENASGRIFQNKTGFFEQMFMELLLNDMLINARENMNAPDLVRVMDDEVDVALFETITREDLTATGRLRPIGARHFATQANMLQNLVQIANSPLGQDPGVRVHMSGKKMAKLIQELLGVPEFGLVSDNIQILENTETQRMAQVAQQEVDTEAQTPAGVTADESEEVPV